MVKKGDTLIEVTLAVGIFSMVAIAIVAVMSGGTSSAQTALETTLAREEIDAQAEALRFIQASYIADKDSGDERFAKLWQTIKDKAITPSSIETSADNDFLNYTPGSCDELYSTGENGEVGSRNAFVINTRKLGDFNSTNSMTDGIPSVYFSADQRTVCDKPSCNSVGFSPSSTYPRIVFGKSQTENEDSNSIANTSSNLNYSSIYHAEGIYIIAVKEAEDKGEGSTTTIINGERASAFYDFYIRTCWYGTDATRPSTIATVIRLYDPDAIDSQE